MRLFPSSRWADLCRRFLSLGSVLLLLTTICTRPLRAEFQAGAAVVDVTSSKLPVLVNGGMYSRSYKEVNTRVHARALAVSDGPTKLVLVVVDSCMMPRSLLDEAKALAAKRTGIPADHMMISATHTHTAPSCMGALGTNADPEYPRVLRLKLADAIVAAASKLQPARIGFGKADASEFTALRRWIRRPDRIDNDPFGNPTVRANMHAGRVPENVTGESGPEDPDLSLMSIQTQDGKPLAVLGNFSMHYFGDRNISADYFGLFSEGLKQRIAPDGSFVGILSHGCSGDIWRRDYANPESWDSDLTIGQYTDGLLDIAMQIYQDIEYDTEADVAMAEKRMTMKYRVPDKQRLEWAKRIVEEMGDRLPKTREEVYAAEQLILHERQETEIVVQGIKIGDIGITTTPNETYAITGLKIKAASPLEHNMVIELANGGDGYIPPPEQHRFGGYNTWAARSAGLEVTAEPKITAACIGLLENVTGKPRRPHRLSRGAAAQAIAEAKPAAWWRLDEFAGPRALDSSGNQRDAIYEPDVTYFLEGPRSDRFCKNAEKNRAAMFVGGRVQGRVAELGDAYSVSMWIWNGMPNDGRDVSGWFFSRGPDHGLSQWSDHLGIGGKSGHTGRLIFQRGDDPKTIQAGKTEIPRWKWQHVVLVRDGQSVKVYLNGTLELEAENAGGFPDGFDGFFLGGRSDNRDNWEGRLDEVAVFQRPLTAEEIAKLSAE